MKNLFKKIAILSVAVLVFGCSKDDDSSSTPTEVVKTKVKIIKYQVDNFSFVAPDGLGWDGINGKPDVYLGLFNGNSTMVSYSNPLDNVESSALPLFVALNSPFYTVPNFGDTINVVVMDSDDTLIFGNSDDEIGYVPFIMSDYTTGANKYPSTVTKTRNDVTCKLFLTWE
jgi:hypothetical protein